MKTLKYRVVKRYREDAPSLLFERRKLIYLPPIGYILESNGINPSGIAIKANNWFQFNNSNETWNFFLNDNIVEV
jgi:hypothetical protein